MTARQVRQVRAWWQKPGPGTAPGKWRKVRTPATFLRSDSTRSRAAHGALLTRLAAVRAVDPGAAWPGNEHVQQATAIEWVDAQVAADPAHGLRLLYAVPSGGFRSRRTAGRMWAEGSRSGVPDLVLPAVRAGCAGLYLEVKAGDGTLSPTQRAWLTALHREGYLTAACWGVDAIVAALCEYLDATPPAWLRPGLRRREGGDWIEWRPPRAAPARG